MPIDLPSLLDVGHLATFLGGTAVGAAGKYLADRFTDQRHKSEQEATEREKFLHVKTLMPKLLQEMQDDLQKQEDLHIREFVVLPARTFTFNHDRPRFEYFQTDHPSAVNQVSILVGEGYVEELNDNQFPIYRLREDFVQRLKSDTHLA